MPDKLYPLPAASRFASPSHDLRAPSHPDSAQYAQRESQTTAEMNHLRGALKELTDRWLELEKRLEPVLRPQPPSAAPGQGGGEVLVPIAAEIRNAKGAVFDLILQAYNTIDRLEI